MIFVGQTLFCNSFFRAEAIAKFAYRSPTRKCVVLNFPTLYLANVAKRVVLTTYYFSEKALSWDCEGIG